MRTSRVSRETAGVVNALSPSRPTPTPRRSLRQFGLSSEHAHSPSRTSTKQESGVVSSGLLGKRKRAVKNSDGDDARNRAQSSSLRSSPRKAPKLEDDTAVVNNDGIDNDDGEPAGPRNTKPRRQPAKHIKGPNGTITTEPPTNWEKIYDLTTAMRKRILAPVDTMGCEALAEKDRSPRDQRLQTLVSLMLSSQTKDTVTAVAMRNLQQNLPGGFNLDSLLAVEPEELNRMIEKVGFHNNKTKFIKSVAVLLREKFAGDIPDTIEGLVSLPGVGPKMAYLCMSAAWGRDEGIGVDVHVHRITNLWRWHKTSTPEQTRAELESWLPREKWHDINHLLVGLGQTICLPIGRRCGECDLSKEKLCPSAVANSPVKKKVKREVEIKLDSGNVVKDEKVEVEIDDLAIKVEADLDGENRLGIKTVT